MTSHIISQFIEVPASAQSIAQRKLVYGIGINDADYQIKITANGNERKCPFYRTWQSMLTRCFCKKYHARQPTYKKCDVSKEWLVFSNFKKWMESQNWLGMQLDKDIINPMNKLYSKENCVFVSRKLNNLLNDQKNRRGKWPIGVAFNKRRQLYISECYANGESNYLGSFNTPEEASQAYKQFKSNHITEIASQQTDERIKNGLLKYAELLRIS